MENDLEMRDIENPVTLKTIDELKKKKHKYFY